MDKLITVSLTAMKEREQSVIEIIKALLPQVDKINLFLHGFMPTVIPEEFKNEKVEIAYDIEWGDKGDIDKFHWIDKVKGYHLIVDDDLIYPQDYVIEMIKKIDQHPDSIVSFHGSNPYKLPIANYYLDRWSYPVLGEVHNDQPVKIIGTGVMGYDSDKIDLSSFKEHFDIMLPNMVDIYFAIYAHVQKIPLLVLEHKANWITHSTFVKIEDTICGKNYDNPFEMTDLINQNIDIFNTNERIDFKPKVSIITINSRMRTHPQWVKQCYDSVRNQTYDNIEFIVIENFNRIMTIGKGYNVGVQKATGDLVLFLADDDFITEDYVTALVSGISTEYYKPEVSGITSYLTLFENKKNGEIHSEARRLIPTGMWKRQFLLDNPFLEYLTKFVDSELMDRSNNMGQQQLILSHHYGYFYRSHQNQVSGAKAFTGGESVPSNTNAIREQLSSIKEL